jgi:ribosomal subunit interface protein
MPLRVSGKNMDIGESLRTHVVQKVEAIIARYFDGKVSGHVVIAPEGSAYRADCSLHLSSGMNLQGEGRGHEPYATFDQAADKIERRLRRYNKRLKEHHASAEAHADARAQLRLAKFVIESPDEQGEEVPIDFAPVVVAEEPLTLKQLSVASAVAELDLSGASLLVFQHATSERLNIVYRRTDGAIGWLDPR